MAIEPGAPLSAYKAVQTQADRDLAKFLRGLAKDFEASRFVSEIVGAGGLTAQQFAIRGDMINLAIEQLKSGVASRTGRWQTEAAKAGWESIHAFERDLVERYGIAPDDRERLKAYLDSELGAATTAIEASWERFSGQSFTPLSDRVWAMGERVRAQLERTISVGLGSGMSAAQLARSVRGFISPDVPGGASYAAMRLARTEINNAYHSMERRRAIDSPFVDAVKWNLSTSHPERDLCDDYAAHYLDAPIPTEHDERSEAIAASEIDRRAAERAEYLDPDRIAADAAKYAAKIPEKREPIPLRPDVPSTTLDEIRAQKSVSRNGVKDAVKSVYEGVDFNGFNLKVTDVYSKRAGGQDIVDVYMEIFDADGNAAGWTERTFTSNPDGTWSVYHQLMKLHESHQGRGFSTAYSRWSEAWYAAAGVEEIGVHAALDRGGYAWAKAGYSWDKSRYGGIDKPTSVLKRLDQRLDIIEGGVLPAEMLVEFGSEHHDLMRNLRNRFESPNVDEWPLPAEIAAIPYPYGKAIMSGTDWYGTKKVRK